MNKIILLFIVLSVITWGGCDGADVICTQRVYGISNTAGAKLYYPCNISGKVGATTMTSGWMGTLGYIEWLSRDVARSGYVVLAFTPSNIYGLVRQWRDGHKACIARLIAMNTNHIVLKGKIDTSKLSTCGHSTGGGGSLWASAQLGDQLRTTIGMAPYDEEGFSESGLKTITAATLIQAATNDSSYVSNTMTRGEYAGLGDISKCYIEYSDMDHMSWSLASGATRSRLSGDVIAWMKYYLDGDTSYASTIANTSGTVMHEWVK